MNPARFVSRIVAWTLLPTVCIGICLQAVALPVSAAAPSNGRFNGVACESAVNCVVVGDTTTGGIRRQMATLWAGSAWSTIELPDAGTSSLNAVGCTHSFCIMAGQRTKDDGTTVPLAEVWTSDKPVATVSPALPAGATSGTLRAVHCIWAHLCVAAGEYTDGQGHGQAFIDDWNGTLWTERPAPSVAPAPEASLQGLACASDDPYQHDSWVCHAVGWYRTADHRMPLAFDITDAAVTREVVQDPAGSQASAEFRAASCSRAAWCFAVGISNGHVLAEQLGRSYSNGPNPTFSWGVLPVQHPRHMGLSRLNGVICLYGIVCRAVGTYYDRQENRWRNLVEVWRDNNKFTYDSGGPQMPNVSHAANILSAVICAGTAGSSACLGVGKIINHFGGAQPAAIVSDNRHPAWWHPAPPVT